MKQIVIAACLLAGLQLPAAARAEMFSSAHAQGTCLTNDGGTARIRGCMESAISQTISMNWIGRENVFYGSLRIGGACLQANGEGRPLSFTGCSASKAQEWKLSGNGILNNGQNLCADINGAGRAEGTAVIAWRCTGATNQIWWNETYRRARVIRIPNMQTVPPGTRLALSGSNIVIAGTSSIVATNVSRIIAAGGGNIIAAGAGNIIASGALN